MVKKGQLVPDLRAVHEFLSLIAKVYCVTGGILKHQDKLRKGHQNSTKKLASENGSSAVI